MALLLPQMNTWLAAERELQELEVAWQAGLAAMAQNASTRRDARAQLAAERRRVHDLFKAAMHEAEVRALSLDHKGPGLLSVLEQVELGAVAQAHGPRHSTW